MSSGLNDSFLANLEAATADLPRAETGFEPSLPGRRGWKPRHGDEACTELTITERDGSLFVEEGGVAAGEGRRGAGPSLGGRVVQRIPLRKLGRNEIVTFFDKLDQRFTPNRGLRELGVGGLHAAKPAREGRILLFLHGTFSSCDRMILEQLARKTEAGAEFLARARQHYDQVLAYDHPTLSVSPLLNARELSLALEGTQARVDIISHSRGGLVARWWLEAFDHGRPETRRAIFVGSPHHGTGLAAPSNLRSALNLLTNFARAIGFAAGAAPMLQVVAGVFQAVTSVTRLVANTPAIDAAVALVPGLAAQSRTANNAELASLRSRPVDFRDRYFAIQANFEPEDPGWKFWRRFRRRRVADRAADVVFDGPNDLVVDTESMTDFHDTLELPPSQILNFGRQGDVHHCNYFDQELTWSQISEWLEVH